MTAAPAYPTCGQALPRPVGRPHGSGRAARVVELVEHGLLDDTEIADLLGLTVRTVREYRRRAKRAG